MTGPEHYRKAEQLMREVEDWLDRHEDGRAEHDLHTALHAAESCLAEAQVHATLALAAATAIPASDDYDERCAWQATCGGDAA